MRYSTTLPNYGVQTPSPTDKELHEVKKNNQIDSLDEAKSLLSGYDGDDRLKQVIDGILARIPEAATPKNQLADKLWVLNLEAVKSGITTILVEALKELIQIVGDKALVAIERDEEGFLLATYRKMASEQEESEDNNNN